MATWKEGDQKQITLSLSVNISWTENAKAFDLSHQATSIKIIKIYKHELSRKQQEFFK